VKKPVLKFAFQMQPAALHLDDYKVDLLSTEGTSAAVTRGGAVHVVYSVYP
jgi:hypothetical protein